MADFDPDAYIKQKGIQVSGSEPAPASVASFDPDAYIKAKGINLLTPSAPPEKPSWYADIVKSIPSALPRAAAGLAGLPDQINQYLGKRKSENLQEELQSEAGKANPDKARIADLQSRINETSKSAGQTNLGDKSLEGWKLLLGGAYHEPETTAGKITDFAVQNALFGAKNPKDLLNAPQTLKSLTQGVTAGAAGEMVPDDMPKMKMAAQMIGGMTPSAVERGLMSPDRATKNAAAMIKQAMQGKTPEQWAAAQKLLEQGQKVGIPLMGPEAFQGGSQVQQLASDVAASPASGAKIRAFAEPRADQVQASIKDHMANIGRNVGGQEAANQAQTAAEKVISNAQEFRTKAASPDYQAQRASDTEALKLIDDIPKIQGKIEAGTKWKNDAVQQAGKWYQFSHEMGLKANDVAKRVRQWADEDASGWENDGGRVDPNREKMDNYMGLHQQGKDATYDAVKAASERQNFIDQWRADLDKHADKLAEKNIPYIESKVSGFVDKLKSEQKLAGDAHEIAAYDKLISDLAPNGKPLRLPSQLESLYKGARDKSDLSIGASSADKTIARVYGNASKDLDGLIQDVSPAIKQGRKIYEEISKDMVDPLFKGPIGKLAGKGVDSKMEASYSRMISELNSKTATPERIAEIADRFKDVDKTVFPNMTRAYLEDQLNANMKRLQGRSNPASGANFSNAIEGTPNEKANLKAMIEKTAEAQGQDSKKVYAGFRNLLDVLDATGRIPGMGSQTQSRMENAAMARNNPVSGAIEAVSMTPTHRIGKWIDDLMYKKTYAKLADVFTAPDSVKKMQELANLKPTSTKARNIVSTMLTSADQAAQDHKKDDQDADR